jgi:NitT/TauT family transport system permease protein
MFVPIVITIIVAIFVVIKGGGNDQEELRELPILSICIALLQTFGRIIISYIFAVIFSVITALLVVKNSQKERVWVPIIGIFQSVPTLAFFPILVFMFLQFGFFNITAIVIYFFTMMWTMTFSLIEAFKNIPVEILSMAKVFNINKLKYLRYVIIPAIAPQFVASSIIVWSQAWNIAIVAEVLHTYLPPGSGVKDLPGIGTELVKASIGGKPILFLTTVTIMIIFIIIINIFVWQNLINYAEKFKFQQ